MNIIKDSIANTLSNEKHVKRNAVIQIFIATIAFILLMRVYPMEAYEKHIYSRQKAFNMSAREDLTGERFTSSDKKLQTVYFSQEHLYQITLYMNCVLQEGEKNDENILFRLYNDAFGCIFEEEYSCADIAVRGYLRATPDMDVVLEQAYYYEIIVPEDITAEIMLPIALRSALAQTENSTIYIDGIINDEVCLIADFDYSEPLTVIGIWGYYLFIIIITAVLYILIMYAVGVYDTYYSKYNGKVIKGVRIAASAVIALAAVFVFIFSVILNRFGGAALDRLFFAAAVIIGVLWAAGAIWLPYFYPKRKKKSRLSVRRQISRIWRNYIQTVSFALLLYALCQYVNADREFYHYTNTRWALIFMAVALLMMYNEKQFLNKLSYIWLGLAFVGSMLYCGGFKGNENDYLLARLTCGVVAAWGLLIINILLYLRPASIKKACRQMTRGQLVYGALWVVFFIFMVVYRYEKTWVFTAVLPFSSMLFLNIDTAAKSRFLKNLTNGILLSFGLVTFFCLLHRPHHYWMLYRYAGVFHTVACTGMYLAVVLGAAIGKLYGRLKDKSYMFIHCYNEFFIVAAALGFILLTMSRTAFLTSAVTIISVAALAAVTYRKMPIRILQEIGMLAAVSVFSFPLIYSAIRMIPAVINEPVRYDIEPQDNSFMIYKGEPIDSDKYMTVERFFGVLFGRFNNMSDDDGTVRVSIENSSVLLAYAENSFAGINISSLAADNALDVGEVQEANDISNGRFDIFKKYYESLSLKGHPIMEPVIEGVKQEFGHAHNSYLQVAFNFGIIAGVVFLFIYAFALWRAVRLMYTQGKNYHIYMVPFALIVVFGFVSLTEWAFHPCIPAGFCFLVLQVLLMCE